MKKFHWRKQKDTENPESMEEVGDTPVPRELQVDYDPDDITSDEPDEPDLFDDDEEDDYLRALEPLDAPGYWNARLKNFQREVDKRLWRAVVAGGTGEEKADLGYEELCFKGGQLYVDARCALVSTENAREVAEEALDSLEEIRDSVDFERYPRIVLGMIQSCLYEQGMGLHTRVFSIWNFDKEKTEREFEEKIAEVVIDPAYWKKVIKK